jgi:hypothetical protein
MDEEISHRCGVCHGTGLEEKEPVRCDHGCNIFVCYKCENKGGFVILPFDTCTNCYGCGIVEEMRHK